MKFINTAALLLPLASAASLEARATDAKYEISGFKAYCTDEKNYCWYDFGSLTVSDNAQFIQSCAVGGPSENGDLPAISDEQCGTFVANIEKSDNGGLVVTLKSDRRRRQGSFTISSEDLETKKSGDKSLQSYKGKTDFSVDVDGSGSGSGSASTKPAATTPTASPDSSASSQAPKSSDATDAASPTTGSEPSNTGAPASTSTSADKGNGATRQSAFAGVAFAVGIMAAML